jgi:hypothetical protein
MNKFYDKLLLAIALLALLAGVGFYFMKSGAVPAGKPQVSTQTADNPYQQVPVPASTNVDASWPEPRPQSIHTEGEIEGWVYDVFTPPKIYIDKDGKFVATGTKPPPPPVPFGVYLAEIQRKPYRIQIEGYIEEVPGDASKSLLLLYDEERMKSIRSRVDSVVADSEFKVLSFDIERIVDPQEGIYKEATATILDQRTGEEVVLTHGERLFDDEVSILVRSNEDPSVEIELSEVGESFETELGQYILKEINLEESAVTVEKLGSEEREAETEFLKAQVSQASVAEPATPETSTNESPDSGELDFIF